MKKFYLTVLFVFVCASLSIAQPATFRSLAVDQMFEYGQAIFDRGDYTQAANVFTKILRINPVHEGAVDYARQLRQKGQMVYIPPQPVKVVQEVPKVVTTNFTATAKVQKEEPPVPNADLKQDIKQTEEAIAKLRGDISDLRQRIASSQEAFAGQTK